MSFRTEWTTVRAGMSRKKKNPKNKNDKQVDCYSLPSPQVPQGQGVICLPPDTEDEADERGIGDRDHRCSRYTKPQTRVSFPPSVHVQVMKMTGQEDPGASPTASPCYPTSPP